MKRFVQLTFAACLALASLAASFPYVTLNNKTNRLSDNGSALTFNGSALGSGSITTNAPAIAAGSISVFVDTNKLGAATGPQLSNAIGSSVFVPIGGGTMTANLSTPNVIIPPTSLTFATNISIDLGLAGLRTIVLTTNTTFSATGLIAGASVAARLTNSTASTLTLAISTNWTTLGAAAPSQILPGKVAVLGVTSWGTTDPEITFTYAVQP